MRGKKTSNERSLFCKFIRFWCFIYIIFFCSFLFLFYGPFIEFQEFWITSAMTTKSHRFLATWFYSDKRIKKVLENNKIVEVNEISDPNLIHFRKYTTSIYRNEYEKQLLERNDDDLYKLIPVKGHGYQGYLVAIYDASRIHIATTQYLGEKGESILDVSKRENAFVAINAGGFYDPDWNGNGALPHGTVISNGKIVSDYKDAFMSGGFIGFNQDNKLVLGSMSKEKALEIGLRDAVEFGPFLIVNGKRSFVKGNGGWGIAPRTVIGQRRDGIVLLLVINGRLPSSIGADMIDLCDVMEQFGAYNAANLDGGSSSELVIQNKITNIPVAGGRDGLRDMPTFWVVK